MAEDAHSQDLDRGWDPGSFTVHTGFHNSVILWSLSRRIPCGCRDGVTNVLNNGWTPRLFEMTKIVKSLVIVFSRDPKVLRRCWGPGLFQNDVDISIAIRLGQLAGFPLLGLRGQAKRETIHKLNNGLLDKLMVELADLPFEMWEAAELQPRFVIILGMLAMQLGVRISSTCLDLMHFRRDRLPTMILQLQVFTAISEYQNDGTEWLHGSRQIRDITANPAEDWRRAL